MIRPAVEIRYFEETQFSYTDSLGSFIPEQTISVGELRLGPTFARDIELDNGTFVRPSLGASGIWNFAATSEALPPASGLGSNDLHARFEAGLSVGRQNEWALDVSGFYDCIGTDEYDSYGGSVRLVVPLPRL